MDEKPVFDEVWTRIKKRSGEVFFTKTGLRFTYKIKGDKILLSRIHYSLSKTDLMKAYTKVPLGGPSELTSIVRGPSYVWAILQDARVSLRQW
ncbi:MAG: hypothetical protein NWE89_08825 [Candidatus Bathyarchaeota archaeon]|nr:hypothetical protein [Candidatus Bathyarchaeota archaeon]